MFLDFVYRNLVKRNVRQNKYPALMVDINLESSFILERITDLGGNCASRPKMNKQVKVKMWVSLFISIAMYVKSALIRVVRSIISNYTQVL